MSLILDIMSVVIMIKVYYHFFRIVKVQLMARLLAIVIYSIIHLLVSAIFIHYFILYFLINLLYFIPNCYYFLHFTPMAMIVCLSNQPLNRAYLKFITGRDFLVLRVRPSLIYQHLIG